MIRSSMLQLSKQPKLDTAGRSPFVYEPLQCFESSIRLLEVFPVLKDGLIRVQLGDYRICEPDRYRCLSYMWGPPSDKTHEIILNDKLFRVRENLYSFLRVARDRFPRTPLWIDAISINQEDDQEKAKQVARMADIYHVGTETLIWLGDDYGLTSALRQINAVPAWHKQMSPADLEDLVKLYTDPYWTRAWIAQEILQSKAVTVHTAHAEASLGTIAQAAKLYSLGDKFALQAQQLLNPMFYTRMWIERHRSTRLRDGLHSIWDLLYQMRQAQCADKRDRIYSILSLVDCGDNFDVSYSESSIELFWRSGEHFCAWNRPHFVSTLRRALGVDIQELKASLKQQGNLELSIPVEQAISHFERPTTSTRLRCKNSDCKRYKKPYHLSYARFDTLLCTRPQNEAEERRDVECPHLLIRPKTSDLALVLHDSSSRNGVFVKKLPLAALQRLTKEGWQGLKRPTVESHIKRNLLSGDWRLQVPAAVVIDLDRCAGD